MRYDRFHGNDTANPADARKAFERDRDRILYTAAFRRLAGITQVAASDVGNETHNRLTHVLEVAQIGRRLAQRLRNDEEQNEIARTHGGLDPEVVEAACLAHDIGHPPFGHLTEKVLDIQCRDLGVMDGFEGNAQSFRIVTKLAERRANQVGLNLTRSTLNALLKYPWARGVGPREEKWNCYLSESEEFAFARVGTPGIRKSIEAELMDWSDDIAYSVHDLEDFFQAGRIPLDRLAGDDEDERERFLEEVRVNWQQNHVPHSADFDEYARVFREFFTKMVIAIDRPYCGDADQRNALRQMTSVLIGRYANAIKLVTPTTQNDRCVEVDKEMKREVTMLKELTWHYVIRDPSLATQQYGQRKIIKGLFEAYEELCQNRKDWHVLPVRYQEIAKAKGIDGRDGLEPRVRLVCDLIAGMTERQAVAMYHRLHGIDPGASLAVILR